MIEKFHYSKQALFTKAEDIPHLCDLRETYSKNFCINDIGKKKYLEGGSEEKRNKNAWRSTICHNPSHCPNDPKALCLNGSLSFVSLFLLAQVSKTPAPSSPHQVARPTCPTSLSRWPKAQTGFNFPSLLSSTAWSQPAIIASHWALGHMTVAWPKIALRGKITSRSSWKMENATKT